MRTKSTIISEVRTKKKEKKSQLCFSPPMHTATLQRHDLGKGINYHRSLFRCILSHHRLSLGKFNGKGSKLPKHTTPTQPNEPQELPVILLDTLNQASIKNIFDSNEDVRGSGGGASHNMQARTGGPNFSFYKYTVSSRHRGLIPYDRSNFPLAQGRYLRAILLILC